MTGFNLIPVIDLKDGMVVHAREGRRAEYAPIRSNLCKGADPETIMAALLRLHPFRTFYFADLDAIQCQGSNCEVLKRLHDRYPAIERWADTGIRDEAALVCWLDAGLGRPVIGSESLDDAGFMAVVREHCKDPSAVLSLDYQGDEFKGPPLLLSRPEHYWPQRVLAMNLHRVGSDKGPDLALIVALAARVPGCQVYAAGGIRSLEDLRQVKAAGAAGALLATALHDGRIGPAHLAQFA
ncbi:MAG TPA: HisA/HisF-related TIM barrel protein [Burkholderiales bacterium]|nr:HisA/HisF-related TIM barrel protein [Burkholderiales bacterium]